jgi:hypothetical protein
VGSKREASALTGLGQPWRLVCAPRTVAEFITSQTGTPLEERIMLREKTRSSTRRRRGFYRPLVELLEARIVFASDFGDAPLPYKTLVAEGGAEHIAIGPTLGASRDSEADGVHTVGASGDDTTGIDDEDGVTFGTIRAGQLGATATVSVQGGSAKLDAWIDFNRDGAWGGPDEQIADGRRLVPGNTTISFDVPSWAADGTAYARFRLSTAGNLGVGGIAADGEVEDYAVTVLPPKAACGCFSGPKSITSFAGGGSVYATDVDGDGDKDVLSAASYDNTIAWYENVGSGNFTPHTITTAAKGPNSVYAEDVDGDGDTDVLSALAVDDKIAWYKNDGNENFSAHTVATGTDGAMSAYATDVDKDGDIDVLSASWLDDKIAWYENDGNEAFTTHIITTAAVLASSVYAADVDGDGDIDVLSASALDNTIAWYENDGNENFVAHTVTTALEWPLSVYAADVDGDDDIDVLSGSNSFGISEVVWYENDGNENFAAHTIYASNGKFVSVYATDVDGDSDIDVLSASDWEDKIAWYENDGSQNFTAHVISADVQYPEAVFATDLDNDGDTDVLSASEWLLSGGGGTGGYSAWYRNDGNQNFTTHFFTTFATNVYAADVDSDGDMDAFTASAKSIAWFENEGDQNFTAHTISNAGASSVYAVDLDGDGDADILTANGNTIAWYENDGSQIFTSHTIATGLNGVVGVYASDVDGDGDMDVLSSSSDDDKIAWYENDGSQNFTTHTITTNANYAQFVSAADVDGDGDTDVLSMSVTVAWPWPYQNILWFENDGNQGFSMHSLPTSGTLGGDVFVADMDGDGDTDIASFFANQYGGGVVWYENDGDENFTGHSIETDAQTPSDIHVADMDGDGDFDVVAASPYDQTIAWSENDGSQNFTNHTIVSFTVTPWALSVYAADVDGDGDLDIFAASPHGKLAWFENRLNVTGGVLSEPVDLIISPFPVPPGPKPAVEDLNPLGLRRAADRITSPVPGVIPAPSDDTDPQTHRVIRRLARGHGSAAAGDALAEPLMWPHADLQPPGDRGA